MAHDIAGPGRPPPQHQGPSASGPSALPTQSPAGDESQCASEEVHIGGHSSNGPPRPSSSLPAASNQTLQQRNARRSTACEPCSALFSVCLNSISIRRSLVPQKAQSPSAPFLSTTGGSTPSSNCDLKRPTGGTPRGRDTTAALSVRSTQASHQPAAPWSLRPLHRKSTSGPQAPVAHSLNKLCASSSNSRPPPRAASPGRPPLQPPRQLLFLRPLRPTLGLSEPPSGVTGHLNPHLRIRGSSLSGRIDKRLRRSMSSFS
ncbi:hypothetical protein NDU88_004862 [Pleurodeles waltl]|uniref:Uncharacterized protein n=1 Tax=Pleurodeles waltl TaxID=8319 RepID=A0AAV7M7J3_PLEWA|nr:hypothetical protein NDU88_004862 [Pleurodeles waltl]